MQTVKTALLILICAALVSACGNRGPLYLPDESQEAESAVEQDKDDEENDKKKDIVSG